MGTSRPGIQWTIQFIMSHFNNVNNIVYGFEKFTDKVLER